MHYIMPSHIAHAAQSKTQPSLGSAARTYLGRCESPAASNKGLLFNCAFLLIGIFGIVVSCQSDSELSVWITSILLILCFAFFVFAAAYFIALIKVNNFHKSDLDDEGLYLLENHPFIPSSQERLREELKTKKRISSGALWRVLNDEHLEETRQQKESSENRRKTRLEAALERFQLGQADANE